MREAFAGLAKWYVGYHETSILTTKETRLNRIPSLVLSALILSTAAVPAMAADSMSGTMAMPKCATGDSVVMVDPKTKTYSMRENKSMGKPAVTGETSDTSMAKTDTETNDTKSDMMKEHMGMKMMCKSAADKMGATLKKSTKGP
ncbi:MAG: hypothetical protein ACREQ5_09890 [Candidatus Dormibacteria bacterium]